MHVTRLGLADELVTLHERKEGFYQLIYGQKPIIKSKCYSGNTRLAEKQQCDVIV